MTREQLGEAIAAQLRHTISSGRAARFMIRRGLATDFARPGELRRAVEHMALDDTAAEWRHFKILNPALRRAVSGYRVMPAGGMR